MGFLLAMTLPALVLAAVRPRACSSWPRAKRKPGSKHGTAMSSTGFDILQEALYPSKKHEIEQRDHESLMAEEDAEGAPPRTRIDLDKGTAHIHLP